jgi:hypothetical protein
MKMKRSRLVAAALMIATMTAARTDTAERVKIAVSPMHSFAPANLQVRVVMEPSHDNRVLEVVADSGGFYRSSQVSLDGTSGPAVVSLQFRNIPGGDYLVAAILRDGSGRQVAAAHCDVSVLGIRGNQ